MKFVITLSFCLFGIAGFGTAVDFDSEIQPILKSRCGKCHMDGESKGKVSFEKELISKEIGGGSIIPGDVKKSDMHYSMTLPPDDEAAMPPKGQRVPQNEIDLIAKWIEEGAKLESSGAAPTPTGSMTNASDSMSGDSMGGAMAGGTPPAPASKPYKGVFKNSAGMQVPATLTRIDGDRAILQLPDGKEYRYPIAMFAAETQDLVKQFQAGTLAPAE